MGIRPEISSSEHSCKESSINTYNMMVRSANRIQEVGRPEKECVEKNQKQELSAISSNHRLEQFKIHVGTCSQGQEDSLKQMLGMLPGNEVC